MSARLAEPAKKTYQEPADKETFFGDEAGVVDRAAIQREHRTDPKNPCDTNLFIGVFFDGTGNNYAGSFNRQDHSESNVARLYSAFPGLSVPGVLPPQTDWVDPEGRYDNYFRIYVPGVGTPFPQVGDSGGGWIDGSLGGAAGLHGQVRLLWALAQVINAVHRFFTRRMLLGHEAIDAANQAPMIDPHAPAGHPIIRHLKHWLETLHEAIRPHILTPGQKRPGNIRPAIVRHLYLATFGFSRGAAEARAFVNWLVRLCKLDAQLLGRPEPMTLAGFPLSHDFLGLFDTVASVGLANLSVIADGHGGWADAQRALRVPREAGRCLHLVAAHENRRSFPLDSIHVGDELPANGKELVYPGVHSDIGGGYRPGDQGKGTEELGADMLSRLPLAEMYRQARLAGVPLKLEHAEPDVQDGYKITPRTIADFNAYLDVFETRSGGTAAIVREHWRRAIEWRVHLHRHGGIAALTSYQRASTLSRNRLASAWAAFGEELASFRRWRGLHRRCFTTPDAAPQQPPAERGRTTFLQTLMTMPDFSSLACLATPLPVLILDRFPNGLDPSLDGDWRRIDGFFDTLARPPAAVATLMDHYVHDAIAGFLADDRTEVIGHLKDLVRYKQLLDGDERFALNARRLGISLSDEEQGYAAYYERTGRIPPGMPVDAREPSWLGAGYLRSRRIYAGADDVLLTAQHSAADGEVA